MRSVANLRLCSPDGIKNFGSGDFPGGAVVKNPPAGDTGPFPGPGRSHMPRSS